MIRFATFNGKFDNKPKPNVLAWPELCEKLRCHEPISSTEEDLCSPEALDALKGRCEAISPATYKPGALRGNANVVELTGFIADIDDGRPVSELAERWKDGEGKPLALAWYTTFKSRQNAPRVRIFFPFAKPVPASEWERVWRNLTHALTDGHNDPSTKDPARLHFLPACPAQWLSEADAGFQEGELLDPFAISDAPMDEVEQARLEALAARRSQDWKTGATGSGSGRPGDDYNEKATQSEIIALLERHGWRQDTERQGVVHATRPGKSSGTSGLIGFRDGDEAAFYCFTSNASPLEGGKLYDPFGLLACLEHDGDFAAAAKALRDQGFGEPFRTKVRLDVNSLETSRPKPNLATDAAKLSSYNLTDAGNSERLIAHSGADIRFVVSLGWRVWDGARHA